MDTTGYGEAVCVVNVPGCVEYFGEICVKCRGHAYLVENRCVTGCEALRDSRGVRFYGGFDVLRAQNLVMDVVRSYYF